MAITASDVNKLRKSTGAGMMDCKKALTEAEGDFEKAVELIRKKGQSIANKRADRDATEGCTLAKASECGKKGAIIVLNCETDFVAKNEDFVKFTTEIIDLALANDVKSIEELKTLEFNGKPFTETLLEKSGVVGEKLEVTQLEVISGETVVPYIHPGNQVSSIVAVNQEVDTVVVKDVAMQVAAMSPVAIDESFVSEEVKEKELEIGREIARREGKPEQIIEKIAQGKLNKFYKESTLLHQTFVKDGKISVKAYLKQTNADLTVVDFKRVSLNS